MRAFVVSEPNQGVVEEVAEPVAAVDGVVVDVHRVGVCGTDIELFKGQMAYLDAGFTHFPLRLGHEWCGTVSAVGADVDESWLGRRVTADTMIGCERCARCRSGRHNVCQDRFEVGVRDGVAGALAERLAVPAASLYALPNGVDDAAGAMVEPGGNALRSVWAASLQPGEHVLVLGTGAIGLLAADFARAQGAVVHLMGHSDSSLRFSEVLGFDGVWSANNLPSIPWDAVIDASNAASLPGLALELVEPGKRVVYIGLAGTPSLIDTRTMVIKDVTAVGILAASAALGATIDEFASGRVDPRPLVGATVTLDEVGAVLAGWRPDGAGPGPKIQIDPRS
jgi:threonine dehydrogenase-like Zn-dependent dehydrogenase